MSEITSSSKISLLYDSLRELLEALAIKNGYKIYNHECYTYFLKEIMHEGSKGDEFDGLRKIRNNINYYGKELSLDESKDILERMKRLRGDISELLSKKKRAFIIHRWDGNPNTDWYPWLRRELERGGFDVETPQMPNTSEPEIDPWVKHLKKIVGKLNKDTYFVAHSIGCQAVMRFLERENYNDKIGKIIFIAGWFKLKNLENKEARKIAKPWINTPINFDKIKQKISKLTVFLSTNEPYGFVEENKTIFIEKLNAKVLIKKDKGHFTEDDKVKEMPEIIDQLK